MSARLQQHARIACASATSCGSKAGSGSRTRHGSIPQDDALIAELTAPTYTFTSTGKMLVESKADMKKRGMRSPDLADAFLLTFAGGESAKCSDIAGLSRVDARHGLCDLCRISSQSVGARKVETIIDFVREPPGLSRGKQELPH